MISRIYKLNCMIEISLSDYTKQLILPKTIIMFDRFIENDEKTLRILIFNKRNHNTVYTLDFDIENHVDLLWEGDIKNSSEKELKELDKLYEMFPNLEE